MRLKIFWSRPSFADVASAPPPPPSHHYWCEKCDRKFFQVDQALEMLRVPLVTILAREMRLNIFWSRPSFGDVASAASHYIYIYLLAREMRLKFFQVDQRLEMLRVPLGIPSHDIGARNAIEFFWSRPSFGDVASAANHDIGARNAIDFSKSTNVWRCCECR